MSSRTRRRAAARPTPVRPSVGRYVAPLVGRFIRPLVRFGAVGLASTVASLGLYAGMRGPVDAQTANIVATGLVGVANAVANQRLTFARRGQPAPGWHLAPSIGLLLLGLVLTSVALAALAAADPGASRADEVAVVVAASAIGGLLRFTVLNRLAPAIVRSGEAGRSAGPRSQEPAPAPSSRAPVSAMAR